MRLPSYAYIGFGILAVSEAGMLAHVEPFRTFHTPTAWTGYILFADGIIFSKRRSSWLTTNRSEFWFLAALSIPLWLVFEAYNLLIHNWHYVGLPQNPWVRTIGYGWAFATIWPGIFETAELIGLWRSPKRARQPLFPQHAKNGSRSLFTLMLAGAAMLGWPIIWPSPYLAPVVWLGFIFLLDPLNHLLGAESLAGDLDGDGPGTRRLVNLAVAGLACGVLWEFWNYWSRAKWHYTVPIMEHTKIFEMPLPGYLGFPAFAVECFTMYVFVRAMLRVRGRAVAL